MALLRKILVGVDGTEASINALRESCRLCHSERARLMAITVSPPYEGDLNLVGVRNLHHILDEPCGQSFAASKAVVQEEGIVADHLSTEGEIPGRIVDVATEYHCDLIVLGYERRSALARLLAGSVVPAVIAASPCDVLVIPQNSRLDWQSLLLVITELDMARRAAERALDFAGAYGARLLIATPATATTRNRGLRTGLPQRVFQEGEPTNWLQELVQRAESLNVRTSRMPLEKGLLPGAARLAKQEQVGLSICNRESLAVRNKLLVERYAALILQSFPSPILVVQS